MLFHSVLLIFLLISKYIIKTFPKTISRKVFMKIIFNNSFILAGCKGLVQGKSYQDLLTLVYLPQR